MQHSLPEIKALDGQLVAISPQLPDQSLAMVEERGLEFMVLSDVGNRVARDFGLDFLAISQGNYADLFGDLGMSGTMATTQVEIGQYITDDVFAALLWRPLKNLGATGQSQFAGLRMEWRAADQWTLEGFVEDRFSRSPLFRAGALAYRVDKVVGFFFWREWGY